MRDALAVLRDGGGGGGGGSFSRRARRRGRALGTAAGGGARRFAEWRLHELALSAVAPRRARAVRRMDSLEQPALGVEAMRRWQRALAPLPGGGGARRESSSGGPSGGPELAYEALIHCVVLPPVRSALVNSWAVREPDAAAALLERWRPLLPGSQFSTLIATQVLRGSAELCLAAEARRDAASHVAPPMACRCCLRPARTALAQIRHKLGALLEATHAKAGGGLAAAAPGAAARAALSPWRRSSTARRGRLC